LKILLLQALESALESLVQAGEIPVEHGIGVQLTRPRERSHGDFSSNLALQLAPVLGSRPLHVAERLRDLLHLPPGVREIRIAGPGFLNFLLEENLRHQVLARIAAEGARYGHSAIGAGQSIQVEFVSANPTGPLHVGHGRGAAYGACVANLLEACGFTVEREYYINDAGRQMNILAVSVWLRYLELQGVALPFPSNGYRGEYVREIASTLAERIATHPIPTAAEVYAGLPLDEPEGGDREEHIDALIQRAREWLGPVAYRSLFDHGLDNILADIRADLSAFGVDYPSWFSERSLSEAGQVEAVVAELEARGTLYREGGALWFRSTAYGDDKDRVVQRENGEYTYFAADIAYHRNKFSRGYARMINIWGADHHGYIARVRAALQALGLDSQRLDILLVQFAILYRGRERVQMSTRSGSFVTLRELREEVGTDAARFFYVQRRCDQHLDFDLDLAKRHSNDNPVYYIQYAHARICSLRRAATERGLAPAHADSPVLGQLQLDSETELLQQLDHFPDLVKTAARAFEPHQLASYLRDLAALFHGYYAAVPCLQADTADLVQARLTLVDAVGQVLHNGLQLLGVQAPASM
jgi:arginyl-tRNA synthetase